jgi:hypothetical protein
MMDIHLTKQEGKLEIIRDLIKRYERDPDQYPGMRCYHEDPMAIYRLLKTWEHNIDKWIGVRKTMKIKETV